MNLLLINYFKSDFCISSFSIKIVRFDRPSSRIVPVPGFGIRWKIWDLNVRVTAKYEAKVNFG